MMERLRIDEERVGREMAIPQRRCTPRSVSKTPNDTSDNRPPVTRKIGLARAGAAEESCPKARMRVAISDWLTGCM